MRSVRKVSDFRMERKKKEQAYLRDLITLNGVSLGLHTLLPAVPPLLETFRKSLFRNGVYLSCCCRHNVLSCLRLLSFQWPLEFGKQPKVTGSHIRRVRSIANHKSLVFCQKSLNQMRGICWSVVVMEAPIAS